MPCAFRSTGSMLPGSAVDLHVHDHFALYFSVVGSSACSSQPSVPAGFNPYLPSVLVGPWLQWLVLFGFLSEGLIVGNIHWFLHSTMIGIFAFPLLVARYI